MEIEKLNQLAKLLDNQSTCEGMQKTQIENFYTYKISEQVKRCHTVYEPCIVITAQGDKFCYSGDNQYFYGAGNFLTLFLPMPIETEIIKASKRKPYLAAIISIDMGRIADLIVKIDRIEKTSPEPVLADYSGIFSAPVKNELLDPVIRLLHTLNNNKDSAILGDSIIDEIYYRILSGEKGSAIRSLLQHRGHINRISSAVDYIHNNLKEPVSIDNLADMVNMSTSGFHKTFKNVMHLSPLQYVKSLRLFKAQTLIREGKNASEAGFLVGYNSPAQFSREYKRHFGYAPSVT